MEKLEIFKDKAVDAFKRADKQGKDLLANLFGKKTFATNIMDICTAMEDVYDIMGVEKRNVVPYLHPVNEFQEWLNSAAECKLLEYCLNEGWLPDWADASQTKHTVYGNVVKRGAGFGLSRTDTLWTYSDTNAGCRLFFKNAELGPHAMKYFSKQIDIFSLSQFSITNNQ